LQQGKRKGSTEEFCAVPVTYNYNQDQENISHSGHHDRKAMSDLARSKEQGENEEGEVLEIDGSTSKHQALLFPSKSLM